MVSLFFPANIEMRMTNATSPKRLSLTAMASHAWNGSLAQSLSIT
jgi:hypothetical protein